MGDFGTLVKKGRPVRCQSEDEIRELSYMILFIYS